LYGLIFVFLAGAASAADQIVFIDLERAFNEFYKTKLAKSKVGIQREDMEKEKSIRVDEMTVINEEVDSLKKEARDMTLTQEVRDEKRILYEERLLDLRAAQKEIDEFVERREKQLQLQVSRMSQTIMDEISQTVIEYAKQEGILSVIDSSKRQAAFGVFMYTHPDVDITEIILTLLNSKRPNTQEEDDFLTTDETSDEQEDGTGDAE
ncbi:MAG: OmpH family outer membrane protein, partial [Kiritimatiellaceae bacterium]|nr:OmpH family outer membrane protein [Kiritimatiellaceae bacterium]